MARTTVIIDDDTSSIIEELKASFGSKTNSAAVRRALVLARIATQNASDDETITLIDRNNVKKHIVFKG